MVTSGSGSGVVSTLVRSLSSKLSAVAKRGLGSLATSGDMVAIEGDRSFKSTSTVSHS